VLFIAHRLAGVQYLVGRIAVMYLSRIIEVYADTGALCDAQRIPLLMRS